MELKRAKEVLLGVADTLTNTRLYAYSKSEDWHIKVDLSSRVHTADVTGEFYPDQLIAIATWMRDPEGVVGA